MQQEFKIGLICGGPSSERGISLNSARSVLDHLDSACFELTIFYVDKALRWYTIPEASLYSNTPEDFDFKLTRIGKVLDSESLYKALKAQDLCFPVIHGQYGEDGSLQSFLENSDIPFIGSSSATCQRIFDKYKARGILSAHRFATLPALLITDTAPLTLEIAQHFFAQNNLEKVVVKPTKSGSSLGVSLATSPEEACQLASVSLKKFGDTLLEAFCKGAEFTITLLQNPQTKAPIPLIPTHIEHLDPTNTFFSYRKKYLATQSTFCHTPPPWGLETTQAIQEKASALFTLFGNKDFARFDGFLTECGTIFFTDFNPISGLEQNSFFFKQAAYAGLTHSQALEHLIEGATHGKIKRSTLCAETKDKSAVHILMGGTNAERQVSVLSGTNVWLKLRNSALYAPRLFLYKDLETIWEVPYATALHHTAEEILHICENPRKKTALEDALTATFSQATLSQQEPRHYTLESFIQHAQADGAFVFLGLHGDVGENGYLQAHFDAAGLKYNGSGAKTSELCMDKYATGLAVEAAAIPGITSLPKYNFSPKEISTEESANIVFKSLQKEFNCKKLLIKPRADGCSTGITPLNSAAELYAYCQAVLRGDSLIAAGKFSGQKVPIALPRDAADLFYLVEPFIQIDRLRRTETEVFQERGTGWIEFTIGVFEGKALSPSITVSEDSVLTLEEKFQGGTGINLTPPPENIVSLGALKKIKHCIEQLAQALRIENYARLDFFYNTQTQAIILIEVNTLPALTPSTVLYHQALAETTPLPPKIFLERIIEGAKLKISGSSNGFQRPRPLVLGEGAQSPLKIQDHSS